VTAATSQPVQAKACGNTNAAPKAKRPARKQH
jgi:hypothetical protein